MRGKLTLAGLFAVGLLGGCASTSPKQAMDDVAKTVRDRSGHTVRWNEGTESDKEADKAIDKLLSAELTVDSAVQIALLANPKLQAELEELSISQADLVQAGLLKNPTFTFGQTAWEQEHIDPNLFASVEQDFLDIVTMPMRKRVAKTELEATKLELGDHVLELAAQVREAFYDALACEQVLAMRRLVDEAAEASSELAHRQHAAGNMSDLALSTQLSLSAQTTLDRRRAERDAAIAREHLNKQMGLWGARTNFKIAPRLPELPPVELPMDDLEGKAVSQRLDIGAARRNLQAMQYALGLAKTTRWFGSVNIAVEAGKLRHTGHFSFGPSISLEIPLFDQRQAQIAKLEAYERQANASLRALAIDVRSDVREARARVMTSRAIVEQYAKSVVPLRENVVRFSQEQYDAMLVGVYQLISAKQAEFDSYREYIEALRDYWVARSSLERAVGGRVPQGKAMPASAPPPSSTSHAPASTGRAHVHAH